MHMHSSSNVLQKPYNVSHQINHLSFGLAIPGMNNPLDGVVTSASHNNMMVQYFLKLVPTEYVDSWGAVISTNQFAYTKFSKAIDAHHPGLPGVFFIYDYNPMIVRYLERHQSFAHFLVEIFAILGGVYTMCGLIDRFVFTSVTSFRRRRAMGKHL